MKNVIIMALTAIFILSGCKSKEEKALEIIKNEMFKTLYDFESYQPIETKVDSAFLSVYTDSVIIKYGYILNEFLKDANEALKEIKEAHSSMDIWSDSYSEYGREQYYKAKEKADKELKKANLYIEIMNAQSDTIKQRAQNIKPEFYGWKVTHKFRCKTKGGNSTIGNYIYYFDRNVKNIIYQEDTEDEDLAKVKNLIKEAIEKEATENEKTNHNNIEE